MDPRGDGRSCPGTEFALLALPSFPGLMPAALHPQLITAGKRRDCIRLRGLPFDASVNDIVTFLGDHSRQIVTQGVHLIYSAEVYYTCTVRLCRVQGRSQKFVLGRYKMFNNRSDVIITP